MNFLRKLYRLYVSKDPTTIFYATRAKKLEQYNMPKGKFSAELLMLTVAFNNHNVINHQIRLLKKNIKDSYFHFALDNSSDQNTRNEIKKICIENNTGYISLPENPYLKGSGSDSHAIVLNRAIKHIVLKYRPKYFGFIDHDIYPVKPDSICGVLRQQPIYGLSQERDEYWYLWPGFCFFSKEVYLKNTLDFMPGIVANVVYDTGGAMYKELYSKYDRERITFPKRTYGSLREGNIVQSDKFEMIDKWLHSFNGSYWMPVKDKEGILTEVLDGYFNA